MADAIFTREGSRYIPTEKSGSPWGDDLVHGGPPAGLLARAIEEFAADPTMHPARLTVDLFRPVPKAPLSVATRTVRSGRRIHVVEATLSADGVDVCRAIGLLLRVTEGAGVEPDQAAPGVPGPDGLLATALGRRMRSDMPVRPGFHTTVEAKWVTEPDASEPPTAWIRVPVPLVEGETPTPLQRVAMVSDFVNALGNIGGTGSVGFINTDITLYLHRLPVGEWVCIQATRVLQPYGVGVSQATIFDPSGPIGSVAQALLANPRR
jgi:hypothetical protein